MSRRYRRNPNFEREVAALPSVHAEVVKAARNAKRHAELASPEGGPAPGYKERFVVRETPGDVTLGNVDIAAHLVEHGSAKNPPYAPLARGVRAAGLRLVEHPK